MHATYPTSQDHKRTDPARVLVVDDDSDARAICAEYLRRDGYCVLEADNGADALAAAVQLLPDVIIMDVVMPEMDGLECTRRLRQNRATAHIPVIMASAATRNADIVAGLEAGADEYVAKPFNSKEFRLRVRSMVRLQQVNKALLRTSDELSEQNRDLGVLLDLSFGLNTDNGLDSILRRIVEAAMTLTGCRSVSVMLPDPEGQFLAPVVCAGEDSASPHENVIPIGEGIAGFAFTQSRPIGYNHMDRVSQARHESEAPYFTGIPVLSAPLCTSDRTVGVLNIGDRAGGRPFEPKELIYLDMVTNLAASAVHDILTSKARDDAHESIVVALAKLAEHRDDDTGQHLDRVMRYCMTLARELREWGKYARVIDDVFLASLKLAVPLHDIGKVAIPDHILLKPGRLTPEEMAIMRTHVEMGAETIRSVLARSPQPHFLRIAEEICQGHHEWYNGGGYPLGLSGEDIPLSARIAALADVYDALTTKRVYKPAMTHEKAFNIIVGASGMQFDPDVVQAFIDREQDFVRLARDLADVPSDVNGATGEVLAELGPRDRI